MVMVIGIRVTVIADLHEIETYVWDFLLSSVFFCLRNDETIEANNGHKLLWIVTNMLGFQSSVEEAGIGSVCHADLH